MKEAELTLEFAREAHERWLIKNNKKDLDKAIELYTKALSSNPNIPESYYRLALLLWENGQISLTTAIEKCKLALTMSPENINARMYTGYFLKLAGRNKEAEQEFKTAIKNYPFSSSRARLNLGLINFEKIVNKEISIPIIAKSAYYLITGILTGFLDYSYIRMELSKAKENFEVGKYLTVGSIYKFLGLGKKALNTYKVACKKTGRAEIFEKLIGDIDIEYEQIREALNSYDYVLRVKPNDRESLLKKATILQTYYEDKTDEAIETYVKALETEGEKEYIYYELGHLYLKKQDNINAVNAFKLSVETDTTNAYFHNALGFALFSAGQYDEAEDHYLIAINLNPEPGWTATVCRAAALIYSDIKKNYEKAIRMYNQSISLYPNCSETYYSLGDLYFEMEDYDKAVENYAKSLTLNQNNETAYNKLAVALWQKGYIEEAIIGFKKAIECNPEYAPAYNNLGAVYLDNKKNITEAKIYFKTAIEIDKEYTMAYYNAARAYETEDNKIQAAKYYGKAKELNTENQEIKNIDIEEKIYNLFAV